MGLLSKAENIIGNVNVDDDANGAGGDALKPVSKKIKVSKKNLGILNKRISEYQKIYRIFGCILLESKEAEKGKADLCEKLSKMTGDWGIASPINNSHALILLPTEMDRDLIAHRLSKSLNAEPVMSFRAISPEYVINRINSM